MSNNKRAYAVLTKTKRKVTMPGLYVVVEGHDGAGKSTIIKQLDIRLKTEGYPVLSTFMPGATKLGAHIRKLVKHPSLIDENIQIDEMSRQLLYLADASNFLKLILEPALSENKIVISDRSSFISSLIYGSASGIDIFELNDLYSALKPPIIDKLIVLSAPLDVAMSRVSMKLSQEAVKDHFDSQPYEYHNKIHELYQMKDPALSTIISRFIHLDNIVRVDTDRTISEVSDDLFKEVVAAYREKQSISERM